MGLMDDIDETTFGMAFGNLDGFSGMEQVTYYRDGKPSLRVNVNVERPEVVIDPETMAPMHAIEVFISREQLASVSCPGDSIDIAMQYGGKIDRRAVKRIKTQDPAGWTLLVG